MPVNKIGVQQSMWMFRQFVDVGAGAGAGAGASGIAVD